MIRSLILLAVLVVAPFATLMAAGPAPEIQPEARAVLERAIESMGGDAAIAAVKALRLHHKGVYKMGETESTFTSEVIVAWPNQIRWELKTPMFNGSAGLDKGVAWGAFMSPPARCAGPMKENVESWLLHHELMLLRPLLHRDDVTIKLGKPNAEKKLEVVTVSIGGRKPYVLRFATKDGKTRMAEFDAPSTLWDGRKGMMLAKLSKPKAFGDITLMSMNDMVTMVGEEKNESFMEETMKVEWNPELAEDAFKMPEVTVELDKMVTKDTLPCKALVMVHKGPYKTIGNTIRKIMSAGLEAGLQSSGQILAIYRTDPTTVKDEKELETDIVLPVWLMGPPPEKLAEEISIRDFPAQRVASMIVKGPYGSHEAKSIPALVTWLVKQGLRPAGPPQILHMHNPENTHPEDQLAEVQVPVEKAE